MEHLQRMWHTIRESLPLRTLGSAPLWRACSFLTLHRFDDRTKLYLHRIKRGFHGAFATGVACKQGALTLPDTWFRPRFGDFSYAQIVEFSRTCRVFSRLFILNTPRYFLDFALYSYIHTCRKIPTLQPLLLTSTLVLICASIHCGNFCVYHVDGPSWALFIATLTFKIANFEVKCKELVASYYVLKPNMLQKVAQ